MDVDGTLTDGRLYIGPDGEIAKAFEVKDGYGIKHILPRMDVIPAIITGRSSRIVEQRCRELGIAELRQGVGDKLAELKRLAEKYALTPEKIAYIGDDENDLPCMNYAGLSACPADAMAAVKEAADHVCAASGGRGAVREFIEFIMENEA